MSRTPSIPPADVDERLSRELNVWLCTVRRDGSPHLTPVWFVYLSATFWVGCESRSVKVRNVVADPRVSVALESGDAPVVAEGDAHVHRSGFPSTVVEAFARKYDGWDVGRQVGPDGERALLEIPVRRWLLAGTAQ
ncbi:pyridoxamine 5'-phosphate oxidase family protein [Micromonospora vinacea]|uniref:pyridoxamine 5'-phosphate oxidase family protein n=1 Tax=Micromonospora TaxID=1873 RepID=UPI001EE9A143|nr:pyridoxamine 5'-phosphate oxidase family protein [Micromonospora hortensis]MCG5448004.1 pyridoxamine 5'-phosphate oxidase family protein [Micromonospora hortensis]WSZ79471.1 pyridoxamine 5'-phosphate oxidase family protein [Micromonospora sp. NBC_00860]WTA70438.1 pyridoxamine 5'-phosphate oxidase family protein [Micromonospora sp. NBC_00855]